MIRRWFRTIEFFERNSGWCFLSPDGLAVGRYDSERTAQTQAVKLAQILKRLDSQCTVREVVLEFAIGAEFAAA